MRVFRSKFAALVLGAIGVLLMLPACTREPNFDAPGVPLAAAPAWRAGAWRLSTEKGQWDGRAIACRSGKRAFAAPKGCLLIGPRRIAPDSVARGFQCRFPDRVSTVRWVEVGDYSRRIVSYVDINIVGGDIAGHRTGKTTYEYIGAADCPPGTDSDPFSIP